MSENKIFSMEQKFVTWKVRSTPTLAEYLREGRMRRHLEIAAIAEKINIRPGYLRALEQGAASADALPGDAYTRGFIRAYATVLKLDADHAIKLYTREKGITHHLAKSSRAAAAGSGRGALNKIRNPLLLMTPRALVLSLVGLVMLGSSLYLWRQFSALAAAPELAIYQPGDQAITKTPSVVVTGKTDTGVSVFINGASAFVDESGNFTETVRLQSGVNALTVVARNKLGKETAITKEVLSQVAQAELAEVVHRP